MRGAGHALAARQRVDAGAHLLGHAHRGEDAEAQHRRHVGAPRRRHLLDRSRRAPPAGAPGTTKNQRNICTMSGMLRKISTYRLPRRTDPAAGVVRSVPTSAPTTSAITQAASAVASVQPQARPGGSAGTCPCRRAPSRAGSPSSSCISRASLKADDGGPVVPALQRRLTCSPSGRPSRSDSR